MGSPFPSLTKTWHSEAYDAISPSRPELSAKGKVIVITGGGGSVGGAAALAFAQAGATKIAVIGRRIGPLEETKGKVESQVTGAFVLVVQGDLANAQSMNNAFKDITAQFGKINILVANAGYLPNFEALSTADPEEWWRGFEINAKGAFNLSRALMAGNAADNCIVVDISTCVVHMPGMANASGYVASKLAGTKIWEILGKEHSDKLSIVHVHPGVIYSELNIKSGVTAADNGKPNRGVLT